jgi:hypothetical protein
LLKSIFNWLGVKTGAGEKVQPAGPPLFEVLEPRLLLNADFSGIGPVPASEIGLVNHAIYVDLDRRDNPSQADVSPVLTMNLAAGENADQPETGQQVASPVDPERTESRSEVPDGTPDTGPQTGPLGAIPTVAPILSKAVGGRLECGVVASAESSVSPVIFQDEQADPAVPDQQDIVLGSETPSIEIRGPPNSSCDSVSPLCEIAYGEEDQPSPSAEMGSISTHATLVAPELPGLRLVDPDTSNWLGQVIYLDFDGEQNVTYHGPVTVGPFDAPAFFLAGTPLAGQEQTVVTQVVSQLQQTFTGSGIIFTTSRPSPGTEYSTIYIGGDDSAFRQYGSFLGLSEQIDAGNSDPGDIAFVFSDSLSLMQAEALALRLSANIAHETAHLLGYTHEQVPGNGVLASVAAESGEIVSVSPSSFISGEATTVTVWVHNTGDSDDMLIDCASKPSGWTVDPGSRNPYMNHDSYYDALFKVTAPTAPTAGGSGTIKWEFRANDGLSNDPLHTWDQSVSFAIGWWSGCDNSTVFHYYDKDASNVGLWIAQTISLCVRILETVPCP